MLDMRCMLCTHPKSPLGVLRCPIGCHRCVDVAALLAEEVYLSLERCDLLALQGKQVLQALPLHLPLLHQGLCVVHSDVRDASIQRGVQLHLRVPHAHNLLHERGVVVSDLRQLLLLLLDLPFPLLQAPALLGLCLHNFLLELLHDLVGRAALNEVQVHDLAKLEHLDVLELGLQILNVPHLLVFLLLPQAEVALELLVAGLYLADLLVQFRDARHEPA
mmetsp:Transcript_76010/g.246153  ORF Transcript_76010/g.246153 Transcript_76010/m.246153 type:complete len:219 (+) Transcript_76010:30-686(+)